MAENIHESCSEKHWRLEILLPVGCVKKPPMQLAGHAREEGFQGWHAHQVVLHRVPVLISNLTHEIGIIGLVDFEKPCQSVGISLFNL